MVEITSSVISSMNSTNQFKLAPIVLVDLIHMQNVYIIIHLRQLLNVKEGKSGAKLLKDIKNINSSQYLEFFKIKKAIPRIFLKSISNSTCNLTPYFVDNFLQKHKDLIIDSLNDLSKLIKNFESKGYYTNLVKNFERLELHNDSEPCKYNVCVHETHGAIIRKIINRVRKNSFNIKEVSSCLDEYAVILQESIMLSIVPNQSGTGFAPIEDYVKVFMSMLQIHDDSLKTYILNKIQTSLSSAIQLTMWPIRSYGSSE